eukprot:TRINITY_DN41532_c0_g2_i1.p1 TRINITY_DN41532_c0_g2~~TRINITY_DN41532_c0_g2_i1.p1  ORF type:complete len:1328 (-),score=326.33 TRINITY_DN41532_c0_g2_i1:226-4209(-)
MLHFDRGRGSGVRAAHSMVRLLLAISVWCLCLVHRAAAAGDPLVDWLASVKLTLQDVKITKAGTTLEVTNLVCEDISVNAVKSVFLPREDRPGVAGMVSGIGLRCNADYKVGAWVVLSRGQIAVTVDPRPSTARLTLSLPLDGKPAPLAVAVEACQATLALSLEFSGSITAKIVNLFRSLLADSIEGQLNEKGCKELTTFAKQKLSPAVKSVNCFMLPVDVAGSMGLDCRPAENQTNSQLKRNKWWLRKTQYNPVVASMLNMTSERGAKPAQKGQHHPSVAQRTAEELEAANVSVLTRQEAVPVVKAAATDEPQPMDLTRLKAIGWFDWVADDLLRPQGFNKVMRWATHGTGNLTLPGPKAALFTDTLTAGETGLTLEVFLKDLRLIDIDSVASFKALRADSPTTLEWEGKLGTKEKPAFGFGATVILRLSSNATSTPGQTGTVDNVFSFETALTKPSVGLLLRLLISRDQLSSRHTAGQFYFDAMKCARSMLLSAPQLQDLVLGFEGVAEPLAVTYVKNSTQRLLEDDLAKLVNRNVEMFNKIWVKYLPGALPRFAASQQGLAGLNMMLQRALSPTQCLSQAAAAEKAKELPPFAGWTTWITEKDRSFIDGVCDGFLKENNTVIHRAFDDLPPLEVTTNTDVKVATTLRQVGFNGFDKVTKLRALIADTGDPNALANVANITCASPEQPWQPLVWMDAQIEARGVVLKGQVGLQLPCGEFQLTLDVVPDMVAALALPLPAKPACLAKTVVSFALSAMSMRSRSPGVLFLKTSTGEVLYPAEELCEMYPDLCKLMESILTKSPHTIKGANQFLDNWRQSLSRSCDRELAKLGFGVVLDEDASEPFYVEGDNVMFWAYVLMSSLALAALGLFIVTRRSATSCLAAESWHGTSDKAAANLKGVLFCTLLAVAVVTRVVSITFLKVAETSAFIDVDALGPNLQSIHLITFTFGSMVSHFAEAGAWLSAALLVLGQATAFGVLLVLNVVWYTGILKKHRRLLVRVALWMNRLVFIDVIFFSHIIPVLNRDVPLPVGTKVRLVTEAQGAIMTGCVSNLIVIGLSFWMLRLLAPPRDRVAQWLADGQDAPHKEDPKALQAVRGVSSLLTVVGVAMWLFGELMIPTFLGIVGMVMPPKTYTGLMLTTISFEANVFLGVLMVLTVIAGPFVQALLSFATKLQGPAKSDHRAVKILREVDALVAPDVVLFGFIGFWLNVDNIAVWIVSNQFPQLVNALQDVSGEQAIGVNVEPGVVGVLGIALATIGSLTLLSLNVRGSLVVAAEEEAAVGGENSEFLDAEEGHVTWRVQDMRAIRAAARTSPPAVTAACEVSEAS